MFRHNAPKDGVNVTASTTTKSRSDEASHKRKAASPNSSSLRNPPAAARSRHAEQPEDTLAMNYHQVEAVVGNQGASNGVDFGEQMKGMKLP